MTDQILPFQLEKAPVRGRLVRLDSVVREILNRHNYPDLVNHFLSEAIALSAALVSGFKFDGIFTLQISGNGALRLIVVDITSGGDIRACARFDADRIKTLEDKESKPLAVGDLARKELASDLSVHEVRDGHEPILDDIQSFKSEKFKSVQNVLGAGYLAFTVDQHDTEDRYQGTVELVGPTLAECLHHFFRQSEQLATGIITATLPTPEDHEKFAVAALLVQKMPTVSSRNYEDLDKENDDWLKTLSILGTTTAKELLDKNLSSSDLLYRLFWEDGVRVFESKQLTAKCRCSVKRIEDMLRTFSTADLKDMVEDQKISVTCEFCGTVYDFDEDEFF